MSWSDRVFLRELSEQQFVLSLGAVRYSEEAELSFRTWAGNVAAKLRWPLDHHVVGLDEAIVAAVAASGFECPIQPLRCVEPESGESGRHLVEAGPQSPFPRCTAGPIDPGLCWTSPFVECSLFWSPLQRKGP